MATQDNNSGLLSKMVRFVRNPTKNWAELNGPDSVPASDLGKEALKQVIDAKRHDDAIRKREFHHLRKMRQASPAVKAELSLEASTFRSSLGDAESDLAGRSSTLKKIDEIEAQMSRQWWKNSAADKPLAKAPVTTNPSKEGATSTFPDTLPSQIDATANAQATHLAASTHSQEFQATVPGIGQLDATGGYSVSAHSAFSTSKMVTLEMGQNLSDPEMEEAAIRYANGDEAGAEAALQAALQIPDAAPEKAIHWASALLDLYRCVGQKNNFERLAIEYAQRFGHSPPTWPAAKDFATPLSTGKVQGDALATQAWNCPAKLDDASVAELGRLVCLPSITYVLNWAAAKQISATAATGLGALLAQWCERDLTLCMSGETALLRIIEGLTPSGDKSVSPQLWQLRFDALRLFDLQDAYEVAALEFCITFELSPPPWHDPICKRQHGASTSPPAIAAASSRSQSMTQIGGDEANAFSIQLQMSNDVLGDVSNLIAQWQSLSKQDESVVISCEQLVRVDFSAAGGLLNWVTNLSAQGRQVEFRDMPRLVAAFFNLIGINEHAKVLSRAN